MTDNRTAAEIYRGLPPDLMPLRAVEDRTGVSVETMRNWINRKGARRLATFRGVRDSGLVLPVVSLSRVEKLRDMERKRAEKRPQAEVESRLVLDAATSALARELRDLIGKRLGMTATLAMAIHRAIDVALAIERRAAKGSP